MRTNLIFSVANVFFNTIFPIIVFPYVARVLGAEGLGTYNYYNLAISYITLFTSFGINVYGVREIGKYKNNPEKQSQTAIELISLNLLNAFFFFLSILIIVSNTYLKEDFLIIFLFGTILISNAIGVEWFFVAVEKQKYILVRSVVVKIITAGCIFYFVKNENDLVKYISIVVLGLAIPAIINFFFFLQQVSFKSTKSLNIKKHVKPLFLIFLVEISIRYFGMADVVLLGLKENKIIVGYYSLALNVFLIISSFIRISAITLLPRSAHYLNDGYYDKFSELINNTIKFILFVGVPCSIGMFIWSDLVVTILGGEKFISSSSLLKFLAPLVVLSSIINMLVFQVLYPQNLVKNITIAFVIGIAINLALNFLMIPAYSAKGVIISSIISQIIILILLLRMNTKYILKSFFTREIYIYIYAGFVLFIGAKCVHYILGESQILLQLILNCSFYVGTLILFREQFFIRYGLRWIRK